MNQEKKLKNIDKKIKRVEVLQNLFTGLGKNLNVIKSLTASVVTIVMLCLGSKVDYFVCVGVCGALWGDFLAECITCYGENLCDKISLNFYDKEVALKKEKELTKEKVSSIDKDFLKKKQEELGLFHNNKMDNKVIYSQEKNIILEDEKNC